MAGNNDFLSKVANLNPNWLWWIIVLLIAGLTAPLIANQVGPRWINFTSDGNGNIGSFIGGVVTPFLSLVTIALVFLTYASQRKELAETSETLGLQQFENAFFELLKVHRENVSQLTYEDLKGRNCFIRFRLEIKYIIDRLNTHPDFEELQQLELIDQYVMAYHVFFYGAFGVTSEHLTLCLKRNVNLSENHITRFRKLQEIYRNELLGREVGQSNPFSGWNEGRKFGISGQRSNLGHYFRHLFQTVCFVHEHHVFEKYSDERSSDLKYRYVKMVRAQLSDYELAIFFIGTLHKLGWDWEWKWSKSNPERNEGDPVRQFITEYRLLKNIPKGIWPDIDIRDFYPGVSYVNY